MRRWIIRDLRGWPVGSVRFSLIGALIGALLFGGCDLVMRAAYAQAKIFNGTTDLINVGTVAAIDNVGGVGGPCTFTAWIKPTTTGEGGLGRMYDKATNVQFRVGTPLNPRLTFQPGTWTTVPSANSANDTIVLGVWQFVAGTFTPGDGGPRLWRGTLSTAVAELSYTTRTAETGTATTDAGSNGTIGNNPAATRTFDGPFEHLALWDQVLTVAQLDRLRLFPRATRHRFSTAGGTVVNLKAYWPLWESAAGTALDHSGNGTNGTVTGTTVGTGAPFAP